MISYYVRSLLTDLLCLIGAVALLCTLFYLCGCTQQHQLSAGQIATTQPTSHPLDNVNQVISHTQKALEPINILSFIATLAGIGLIAYGIIGADKPLENIGLMIALIAGCIALGTLAGIVALPFAPWILLLAFLAGVGYVTYVIVKKFRQPATTPIPAK